VDENYFRYIGSWRANKIFILIKRRIIKEKVLSGS
jgi:hypothetical protein